MAARAQEIRMALGAPKSISVDGAEEIAKELKAYYAPDALDAIYRDAWGQDAPPRILSGGGRAFTAVSCIDWASSGYN